MRAILTLAVLFLWSCQEKPEVVLASPKIPKETFQIIRFHNVENDKLGLIQLGLQENACRELKVIHNFAEYISEFRCREGPEGILSTELARLLTKYSVSKRIQYKEGKYDVF